MTNSGHHVGLFVTCLVDLLRPQTGFAAADLIENSGCRVSVPAQSCCGQPAYNSGDRSKARALAKNVIAQFEGLDYVVAPSGSCAAMIKAHYPQLLAHDPGWPQRAQTLADKTFELSQFLVDIMKVEPDTADLHEDEKDKHPFSHKKFTYHDACSGLRELGIRAQPRKMLAQYADIVVEEMSNSEICCGFGGIFCIKYPEISTRLADNKISGIEKTGADVLIGGDLGCLIHLAGRLKRCAKPVRVYHFAELLLNRKPAAGVAE